MSRIEKAIGDTWRLNIRVKLNGEYLNLEDDDYQFESYYRKADGTIFEAAHADHEIVEDQDDDDNTGKMIINIAATDTKYFKVDRNFDIVLKITDSDGNVLHYTGKNMLTVKDNRPKS